MRPCLLLACLLLTRPASADVRATHLTCEYLTNPLVVDVAAPRMGWWVESHRNGERQTAYRILVASSPDKLKTDEGDLWDSGKVASDESIQIAYGGKPLESQQRAWWKVRIWGQDGKPGPWSEPAFWENKPFDWHGVWIARSEEKGPIPAPLLRRQFFISKPVARARAYICGLGYCELRLNAKKVGDHMLDPGYTRYDRRHLYVAYDILPYLKEGDNAAGVMLGPGWYDVHQKAAWNFDRAPWRASPRMLVEIRLEFEDGSHRIIASDEQWKSADGPIRWSSIYGGETYDAREEKPGWDSAPFDDSGWQPAKVVDAPAGILSAQMNPPIRIERSLTPVKITEPKPGVWIVDFGQNFAGLAELRVRGTVGDKITMRYAEKLHADGTLDNSNINVHMAKSDPPPRFQTDEYVLKGGGPETWHARFNYHGFRWVEVTGFPDKPTPGNFRGLVMHSDVPSVGSFECSNPLLNKIHEATRWAYLSNLQGIPTDCPHREKNGWTGDAQLACEAGLFNFDSLAVYTKWIQDLEDEQRESGELPGIVPTGGWGYDWGNGPAWDSAFLLIPWHMYIYSGDTRILTSHFPAMKRYVDYLTSKARDGIVSIGLGDWVPWKTETPVEVTSTAYYFRDAQIVSWTARLLGKAEDENKYADLAESIREAFNKRFYYRDKAVYANGSQTALSCALYQGLADNEPGVMENLIANIEARNGHIDTGILGAKYLLNTLSDHGRADVAYRIATQKDQPGWGWWFEQGATTLWESWGGEDSRNHIMFGDISAWMVKTLAGIRADPAGPGFKYFYIDPHPVGDLTFAKATYDSVRGRISSSWVKEGRKLTLEVTVPPGCEATVHAPGEPGTSLTVEPIGNRLPDFAKRVGINTVRIGSGRYRFVSQ